MRSIYAETDEVQSLFCLGRSWTLRMQRVALDNTGSAVISWRDRCPCMKTSLSLCLTWTWSSSSTCAITLSLNYSALEPTTDISVRIVSNLCSIKLQFPFYFILIIILFLHKFNEINASHWDHVSLHILYPKLPWLNFVLSGIGLEQNILFSSTKHNTCIIWSWNWPSPIIYKLN
jgi:hypothetical protein